MKNLFFIQRGRVDAQIVFKACLRIHDFENYPQLLKMTKHSFSVKCQKQKSVDEVDDDDEHDLHDDELNEWEEELFIEKKAAKTIQVGDLAVIKTSDDHPYYLLKVTSALFETESEVTDAYRHTFPSNHRVVEGLKYSRKQMKVLCITLTINAKHSYLPFVLLEIAQNCHLWTKNVVVRIRKCLLLTMICIKLYQRLQSQNRIFFLLCHTYILLNV